MTLLLREICRQEDKALTVTWSINNRKGSYASATISGALTHSAHGLLVARPDTAAPRPGSPEPLVLLAKLDEEVEVDGHLYKLGTNEYSGNVISPDGFLYLQQVEFDEITATFVFEAGRFQLTKTVWFEQEQQTLYVRYTLGRDSTPVTLTLLPFCDHRETNKQTHGSDQWRFQTEIVEHGIRIKPYEGAIVYRIFVEPAMAFTPLDLWYWRIQLRGDNHTTTDLFVPGLFRGELAPGESLTLIATSEEDSAVDFDIVRALERARAASAPIATTPPVEPEPTPPAEPAPEQTVSNEPDPESAPAR